MCKWLWSWVRSRGWKNFEMHGSQSLDYLKQTVGRSMDVKAASGEGSEEVRGTVDKAPILRENTSIITNKIY